MEKVDIKVKCPKCNDEGSLTVGYDGFIKWRDDGMLIQQAFPELSADDRERLITGWCTSCWDDVFCDD